MSDLLMFIFFFSMILIAVIRCMYILFFYWRKGFSASRLMVLWYRAIFPFSGETALKGESADIVRALRKFIFKFYCIFFPCFFVVFFAGLLL